MSEKNFKRKLNAYQKGYSAGVRAWGVIMDDVFRGCLSEEEAEDYRKGYMAGFNESTMLIREELKD